ncbi:glycosyl hydrolase [Natronoflexus pectinivorans]|uniref:Putative secreted protein (Por secretion system target) n=1 Tax=Natronoflexus pectinivorans TaxID=682526 RepID=A0A4R2GLI8_9BACT|nr:glycosyl hydrolase [Natronoflexus pectinivorans]TCO09864.1 putative secreted protein (Por secretion system target) [Natronoflexus pectinivorans]
MNKHYYSIGEGLLSKLISLDKLVSVRNRLRLVFAIPVFLLMFSTMAITPEVVEFLENENRVLDQPYELHITADENPLVNSTISLNHVDGWVFFLNIKPSVVNENYIDNILVNGEPFQHGVNGRIGIYAHGAVLMPHGSGFRPLTVFTEEGFEGESRELDLHTYHNNLGDFNNEIRSFILKRGYQATFAVNSDGLGYSRVFIADQEDVEIDVMPELLNGTVSFVRVFRHQWVSKKGWAGWNMDEVRRTNSTWYYDWGAGGNTSLDYEYVPNKHNAGWPGWNEINNKQNISHLMGFNEPDRPDQANMTFDAALAMWPEYMKSGLRIGSPATSDPFNNWSLFNFIDKCDELDYRVDFVVIHAYWGGMTPRQWYDRLLHVHERTGGRPIWIKEWNNGANWTNEWWPESWEDKLQKQLNDLQGILNVLDTTSFVERYSIYSWVEAHREMFQNGEFTPAGAYYASTTPPIGYNSAFEVIPSWSYRKPELSGRHLTLSNSISLSWTDPNGDLSQSYIIEKKTGNGSFEVIYNSSDVSVRTFADPVDPNVSGITTYRLGLESMFGGYVYSNEYSFYQTEGDQQIQAGKFPVNNPDWSRVIFAERFSENPMVLLGAPSFQNVVAYSTRVNSASVNSFNFRLHPWNYISNPNFNSIDQLSTIALVAGNYNFGGLKAETKAVTGVTQDWVAVTFDESFETVPAVFCTQVSNSNNFATVVAVRNITTEGFEVAIRKEEGVTSNVFGERINYLAIETGTGEVDGKRITVGRSEEGSGITSQPVNITFDNTYSEPGVFAGLQSTNNPFASVVRHHNLQAGSVNLLRQREMSGAIVPIQSDVLAWMIIDFAADQSTSIGGIQNSNSLKIFPNPTRGVLFLNIDQPAKIEVVDMFGRLQIETVAINQIDVSSLPSGFYILKVEDHQPVRFLKQ